jgi:hypothetical protein
MFYCTGKMMVAPFTPATFSGVVLPLIDTEIG